MPTLLDTLTREITAALADDTLHRNKLRMLVIGPTPTLDAVGIWGFDRFEQYPSELEVTGGAPEVVVPLTEWFEAAVEIERRGGRFSQTFSQPPAKRYQEEGPALNPPFSHPEPAIAAALERHTAALDREVAECIRALASTDRLGAFKRLVIYLQLKAGKSAPFFTALSHPLGGKVAWLEDPDGTNAFGACTPDGLTLFYPEEKPEGLKVKKGEPPMRSYTFDRLDYWKRDHENGEGVILRLKKAEDEITLKHGYSSTDDTGGPSDQAIDAGLVEHFAASCAELELARDVPLPATSPEFERYTAMARRYRLSLRGQVERLVERSAFDQAPGLIRAAHPEARDQLCLETAEAFRDLGFPEQALRVFNVVPEEARRKELDLELDCLRAAGRHADVLKRLDEVAPSVGDEDDRASHALRRAMSLALSGQVDKASKLLAAQGEQGSEMQREWARAVVLQQTSPAKAIAALQRALRESDRWLSLAQFDFAKAPTVRRVAEELQELRHQIKTQQAKPDRDWPVPAEVNLAATPCVVLSHPTDRSSPRALKVTNSLTVTTADESLGWHPDGSTWWSVRDGQLNAVTLPATGAPTATPRKVELPADASISGLALWGTRLVYRTENQLWVDGRPIGLPVPIADRYDSAFAVRRNLAVVEAEHGLLVIDLTAPDRPRSVLAPAKASAGDLLACAFASDQLLIGLTREQLFTVDLKNPAEPKVLCAVRLEIDDSADLRVADRFAVVRLSRGEDSSRGPLAIIDVSNPRLLQVKALVESPKQVVQLSLSSTELSLVDSYLRVFSVGLNATGLSGVVQADQLPEDRENELHERSLRRFEKKNGRVFLGTDHRLITIEHQPVTRDATNEPAHGIGGLSTKVARWVDTKLAELKREQPALRIGALIVRCQRGEIMLKVHAARTLAALDVLQSSEAEFTIASDELFPGVTFFNPPKSNRVEASMLAEAEAWAWAKELAEALRRVGNSQTLAAMASGRVYLCEGSHRLVTSIVVDPNKPWEPTPPPSIWNNGEEDDGGDDDE